MSERHIQDSQLFTVRIWAEDSGGMQVEWRGEVKHIPSGRSRYFREWNSLLAFMTQALTAADDPQAVEFEDDEDAARS